MNRRLFIKFIAAVVALPTIINCNKSNAAIIHTEKYEIVKDKGYLILRHNIR